MKRLILSLLAVLSLTATVQAWGAREAEPGPPAAPGVQAAPEAPAAGRTTPGEARDGQRVRVTGTLHLVGSAPFPRMVITDADGVDWYIAQGEEAVLSGLDQRPVTVEAVLRLLPMIWADGRRSPDRRELTGVRRLSPP